MSLRKTLQKIMIVQQADAMIARKLNSYHRIKEESSDMRSVKTEEITRQIREMCIEANHFLSSDMKEFLTRR